MCQVIISETFKIWLRELRDNIGKANILRRISRAEKGNLGDYKPVRGKIFEFRIDVGPGYRLYFAFKKKKIILLLYGGNKSNQNSDITRAERLLNEWEANNE